MSKEQGNGDPLPYREVDRSLKPKLPHLAGLMQRIEDARKTRDRARVTTQHALGSLIDFWDLCADPRELEAIAKEATDRNATPERVLSKDDVERLFEIASGYRVAASDLVALRLLEPRGSDMYRVRGMSRDFKPIVKRLVNRKNAAEGGKKSAESRAAAHGTAQPKGGKGSKSAPDAGSAPAQATTEAQPKREPKRNGNDDRSVTEAERNPSGQRSAISDTSSSYEDDGDPPSPFAPGVAFFDSFQARRVLAGFVSEDMPARQDLGEFFIGAMRKLNDTEEGTWAALEVAWEGFSKDPYWLKRALAWAGFVEQWPRHVRHMRHPGDPALVVDRSESQEFPEQPA
jgi:hypothetical protein